MKDIVGLMHGDAKRKNYGTDRSIRRSPHCLERVLAARSDAAPECGRVPFGAIARATSGTHAVLGWRMADRLALRTEGRPHVGNSSSALPNGTGRAIISFCTSRTFRPAVAQRKQRIAMTGAPSYQASGAFLRRNCMRIASTSRSKLGNSRPGRAMGIETRCLKLTGACDHLEAVHHRTIAVSRAVPTIRCWSSSVALR